MFLAENGKKRADYFFCMLFPVGWNKEGKMGRIRRD